MTEDLYQCTAKRLATKNPETVDSNTTAGEAHAWFQRTGFDYAPVVEAGEPVGYLGINTVADVFDGDLVKQAMSEIRLKHIISSDASFSDILTGLKEQSFYLLGGKNQVTGILTRADLNTSPARIHLFDRISLLEIKLRELIKEVASDWREKVYLPPDKEDKIDRLHREAKDASIELSEIHYAGFSTLKNIVGDYEDCWRACGYETDHKAESDLAKIRDLRNDVAHSNLILQTTSSEYDTPSRSIRDLIKIYAALQTCIRSLQTKVK